VLVAGGAGSGFLSSAELYDPANGTWTTTGSMNTARYFHTETLLANGKVLVAGGYGTNYLSSAELYDTASGTWTSTGSLNTARQSTTATLLPGGKVLVAGGYAYTGDLSSAELYDPAVGTWTSTGSLNTNRSQITATLLPGGTVLVAGGVSSGVGSTYLSSAELYDPASGTWTTTGSLSDVRYHHAAMLLPNGKVLVAGGFDSTSYLSSAELFDPGLGFSNAWQPQISTVTSPLSAGAGLKLSGAQFRGISEGSGGNGSQDSSSDYPLVQLRGIESGQTMFLRPTNWSANSFASTPVTGFPPGWALATVFVDGIPSSASVLLVGIAPLRLNVVKPPGGPCQLTFTNAPGVTFTVLGSQDLATPVPDWIIVGIALEISPGHYQFADPDAAVLTKRLYLVRWP
jgi:hypothetical protein